MIIVTYGAFRTRFATRAVPSSMFSVDFTANSVITKLDDDWNSGTNPFSPPLEVGMRLFLTGSASGNDSFTIGEFTDTDEITVTSSDVVTEASVALTDVYGMFFDGTGWPTWPVQFMRVGDTASTFDSGIENKLLSADTPIINTPYHGGIVHFSPNGFAADSVYGADEYDWYVSQRTDDPSIQYLDVSQASDDAGDSFSGTCAITTTALAQTKFGFSPNSGPIDPDITRMLFRGVQVYVRRISDQAIQRVDALSTMMGL